MRGGAGVGDLLREKGGQARGRFAALAGWEDVGQAYETYSNKLDNSHKIVMSV